MNFYNIGRGKISMGGEKEEKTRSKNLAGFKELIEDIKELEEAGEGKIGTIKLEDTGGILSDNLEALKKMAVFWAFNSNSGQNKKNSLEAKLKNLDNYLQNNKTTIEKYKNTGDKQMGESDKKEVYRLCSDIMSQVNSIITKASTGKGGINGEEGKLKERWEKFIKNIDRNQKDLLKAVGEKSMIGKASGGSESGSTKKDTGEELEERRKEIEANELPEARFQASKINMEHEDMLCEYVKEGIFSKLGYGKKGVEDYSRHEFVYILPDVLKQLINPDFNSLWGKGLKGWKSKVENHFSRPDKSENKRLVQIYREAIFNIECGRKYEIQYANKIKNDIDKQIYSFEKDDNQEKIYTLEEEKEKIQQKIQRLKSGDIGNPEEQIKAEKNWPEIKGEKVAPGAKDEYDQTKWMLIENARHNIGYFANSVKFRKNRDLNAFSNDYDENPIMLSNICSGLDALSSRIFLQHSKETSKNKLETEDEDDGVKYVEDEHNFDDGVEDGVAEHDFGGNAEDVEAEHGFGGNAEDVEAEYDFGGKIKDIEAEYDFDDIRNVNPFMSQRNMPFQVMPYALCQNPGYMFSMMMPNMVGVNPIQFWGMQMGVNPMMYMINNQGNYGITRRGRLFNMNPQWAGLNARNNSSSAGVLDRIKNMYCDEWAIIRATALTIISLVEIVCREYDRVANQDSVIENLDGIASDISRFWIRYNNLDIKRWQGQSRERRLNVLYKNLKGYVDSIDDELEEHKISQNISPSEEFAVRNINKIKDIIAQKQNFFNPKSESMLEMYQLLKRVKLNKTEDTILGYIYIQSPNLIFKPSFGGTRANTNML